MSQTATSANASSVDIDAKLAPALTVFDQKPVLIAGAGIAGLAAAIALGRKGIASRVLERRAVFHEAGAGIQIGPNGVKALRALGVADALHPLAGRPDFIAVRDARSGRQLADLPLGNWIEQRHGAPYWTMHRADLHDALLAKARGSPGVSITMGADIVSASEIASGVRLTAREGAGFTGEAVIAADGLWSVLRRGVVGGGRIRHAGRRAYRTVLPAHSTQPDLGAQTTVGLWLAPGIHVVHYPVRSGAEIAMVLVVNETDPLEGWHRDVSPGEIAHHSRALAPALAALIETSASWKAWSLWRVPHPERLARGRVALAGDAAHPMLPFLAQGGVMALEDAIVLAECLGKAHCTADEAFTAYDLLRRGRVRRVSETARRNGMVYHLSGGAAFARDLVLRATPGQRLMAGYDWLYGHDPAGSFLRP